LLLNFALECAIRKVQENQESLKLSGSHQPLVYTDVNLLVENINAVMKNTEALLVTNIYANVNKNKLGYTKKSAFMVVTVLITHMVLESIKLW
jgi:hypothetical protein